jgi:hypothetical protein
MSSKSTDTTASFYPTQQRGIKPPPLGDFVIDDLEKEFLDLAYDELSAYCQDLRTIDPIGYEMLFQREEVRKRVAEFVAYENRTTYDVVNFGKKLWN